MTKASPAEQLEILQAQVTALQQQNMQLQQLMHQRAEPTALEVLDTIGRWVQMAQQGHPQARELLAGWVRAQDAARELVAGPAALVVARANGSLPRSD
jgi:hypothetical protein